MHDGGSFIKIMKIIIMEQNRALISEISKKYDREYSILEKKYLTPTYYSTDINVSKMYTITYTETNNDKLSK